MEVIIEALQYPWALRALAAAILVGMTCGLLGCFIVLRNMALIGDALSHSILPGIVVAFLLFGYSITGFFSGAVFAGVLTAVAILWIQEKFATKSDAAVGIVFTTMFALGVIGISLISTSQGIHLDLKDFLFGNVLGVGNTDLYLTGIIAIFTLLSIVIFYRQLFITSFQPIVADTMGISSTAIKYFLMILLSLAVVASLQMVGVILVVSMLITPAATALLLSDNLKKVLIISAGLGMLAGVSGFMAAIVMEITPGPAMAVMSAIFYVTAGLFAPEKGLLRKIAQGRKSKTQILREDILKNIYKILNRGEKIAADQFELEKVSPRKLKRELSILLKKGLIKKDQNLLDLTADGSHKAIQLVRAHRLWESYLAGRVGLSEAQIHEDAEILEHLLPEELLDEVDKTLGYPETDPHGSPIPPKINKPAFSITHLYPNESAAISRTQISEHVSAELWSRGISPDTIIILEKIEQGSYFLKSKHKTIQLPSRLARMIRVEKK